MQLYLSSAAAPGTLVGLAAGTSNARDLPRCDFGEE